MEYTESNKFNVNLAAGSFGDSQPLHAQDSRQADEHTDFAENSAGLPNVAQGNKFPVNTTLGDSEPLVHSENDQPEDYAHDTAGFGGSIGPDNKTPMDMTLAPNKFPRETGHDTVGDDIVLT